MLFSIVIPAYQCQELIKKTVNSILQSGIDDYEIIIVDDGSTDQTGKICKLLEANNSFIRYFYKVNEGVSIARNYGIEKASGKYTLFVDADDTLEFGSLKSLSDLMRQNDPDILIFGLSFDYYKKGKIYKRQKEVFQYEGILNKDEWSRKFLELYKCNSLTPVWNKVYKTAVLKEYVKFNPQYFIMEDFLFVLDYLNYCDSIYSLPEVIYRYRQPEKELHGYARIKRVRSLNDFMGPFEKLIQRLVINKNIKDADIILGNMYFMILEQKIFKASRNEIREIEKDYINCKYHYYVEQSGSPKLRFIHYNLSNYHTLRLWIYYFYIRSRHRIAEFVKRRVKYRKRLVDEY